MGENKIMKSKHVFMAGLLATGLSVAHAVAPPSFSSFTTEFNEYTVTYQNDTTLGGFASTFSTSDGGGNKVYGFTWKLSTAVQVASPSGAFAQNVFALPQFTITANPGWTLAGPLTSVFGNLSFVEFGDGATTNVTTSGKLSFNGAVVATPVDAPISKTRTSSIGLDPLRFGYFGDSASYPQASFLSVNVSDAFLTLTAGGGSSSAVFAETNSKLEFGVAVIPAPIPEPHAWAMLLAGLGLMGVVARRRQATRPGG